MLQHADGRGRSREPASEMSADAPRVYYGWYVLGGLSVTQIVSWGILYYAFGTLLPSMQVKVIEGGVHIITEERGTPRFPAFVESIRAFIKEHPAGR